MSFKVSVPDDGLWAVVAAWPGLPKEVRAGLRKGGVTLTHTAVQRRRDWQAG